MLHILVVLINWECAHLCLYQYIARYSFLSHSVHWLFFTHPRFCQSSTGPREFIQRLVWTVAAFIGLSVAFSLCAPIDFAGVHPSIGVNSGWGLYSKVSREGLWQRPRLWQRPTRRNCRLKDAAMRFFFPLTLASSDDDDGEDDDHCSSDKGDDDGGEGWQWQW